MIKVYNMSSGKLVSEPSEQAYSDEVLYSEWQPIVKDFMEIRLQLVQTQTTDSSPKGINDNLADADCESFINSQSNK